LFFLHWTNRVGAYGYSEAAIIRVANISSKRN
jgi:hypothetical protein